ncbi:MAG: site-specific DNA-methyltransferase, partial [Dehalococcoidia bacterium]|nr:site-specific DNA-methyltransferase [Dehalococcoidia bacterium]
ISHWLDRRRAYPTNVLHMSTECGNKNHSAAFPEALPEWFIKLFTQEGDWVLDPFVGSGTTSRVAQKLGRNSIGIEFHPHYYEMVRSGVDKGKQYLIEKRKAYEEDRRR